MSASTLKRRFFSTRDAGGRRRLRLVRVVSVPEILVKVAGVLLFFGKLVFVLFSLVGALLGIVAAVLFVFLVLYGIGLAVGLIP